MAERQGSAKRRVMGRTGVGLAVVIVGVLVAAGPAAATPTLVAPSTGAAGRNITISGTGWSAFLSLTAYLKQGATQTSFCSLSTDNSGDVVPTACALPTTLPAGSYTLLVTDGASASMSQAFGLNPAIKMTATQFGGAISNAAVGQTVWFAGNGFVSGGSISTVTVGTTTVTATPAHPSLTAQGGFTGATFVVPSVAPKIYTVTATDGSAHAGTAKLNVFAATVTAPASGASGRSIAVGGSGWPSNDSLTAYLGQGGTNTAMCSPASDGDGIVSLGCAIPTGLAAGSYSLILTDGQITVTKPFTVNAAIKIAASQFGGPITNAAVGQTVWLSGTGFGVGGSIASTKVGTTAVTTTPVNPSLSGTGGFTGATFVVPSVAPKIYTVTSTDGVANAGTTKLNVYAATVTAPATGKSGRYISVGGGGWPANDGLTAYLSANGTNTAMCSPASDGNGAVIPISCQVPTSLPAGSYSILLSDGQIMVTKPFTLNPGIKVGATQFGGAITNAAAGQTVWLSGGGFAANGAISSVTVGSTAAPTTPASPAVSAQGSFTGATFVVPAVAPKIYKVTATDGGANAGSVSLAVWAATVTAPANGAAGKYISIGGAGWPANDSLTAYVSANGTNTAMCSPATDGDGVVGPTTCQVPTSIPAGSYSILLSDGQIMVNKAFTLKSSIKLSASQFGGPINTAAKGSTVWLSGNGFTMSGTITSVKLDSTTLTMSPATPFGLTAQGLFNGESFVVPNVAVGAYTVTVTDSGGKTATAPLQITT